MPLHVFSDMIPNGLMVASWNTVNALALQGHQVYVVSNRTELKTVSKHELHQNIKLYTIYHCPYSLTFDKTCIFWNWLFCLVLVLFHKFDFVYVMDTVAVSLFSKIKFVPLATRAIKPYDYQNLKYGQDLAYDRARKKIEEGLRDRPTFLRRVADFFVHNLLKLVSLPTYPRNLDVLFYMSQDSLTPEILSNTTLKLYYIYQCTEMAELAKAVNLADVKKLKNNKFIFLFVGKIGKRKGIDYLVRAFNRFAEISSGAELWLIGAGAPDTVEWIKGEIKTDRIKILGKIPYNLIPLYYLASDVFILPSLEEASSNSITEAMAVGLPVITTNLGAVADFFVDGQHGYTVPSADSEAIFATMEKIFNNPDKIREIKENNRLFAAENFTREKVAKVLIKAFQENSR